MSELTLERLAELRRVAEAATQCPRVWNRETRDLIPRLENEDGDRKALWWTDADEAQCASFDPPTCLALLNEIDRLRQRVADLEAGLRPVAKLGRPELPQTPNFHDLDDDVVVFNDKCGGLLTAGDCRTAARLLAEDQK